MGNLFLQMSRNKVVLVTALAWLIAQAIKVILGVIKNKTFDFRWLIGTGGMPSSHAAGVTALATSIGKVFGFSSPTFGLALVFAFVVMFDAQGVRQSAGVQAKILNKIMEDLYSRRMVKRERIRELLGHTPVEVLVGASLGILVTVLCYR